MSNVIEEEWGQPAPPMDVPRVDGLAVASMVLGIVWIYWLGSILAVIFGAVAIRRIDRSNGWRTGRGMATAGLILGLVGLVLFVLVFTVEFLAIYSRSQSHLP